MRVKSCLQVSLDLDIVITLRYQNCNSTMEKKKEQAPVNGARLELVARYTLPDGRVIEKKVEAAEGIPSPEEFDVVDKDSFLAVLDRYEKGVVDVRDRLVKSVGEAISDELKKTTTPLPHAFPSPLKAQSVQPCSLSHVFLDRRGALGS